MLRSAILKTTLLTGLFLVPATFSNALADNVQQLVDSAKASVERFAADPNMTWFRNNLPRAQGIMIIPRSLRGGFVFGGSGGSGAMLARTGKGAWSYPTFYTMGSVTFGLQAGGEVSEIALMVMTKRGIDALLTNRFKLGADISVAAGPVGAGARAQTADILAFSRSKGAFGGLNVEGAVIATREDWNRQFYNDQNVRAVDILIRGKARNPGANALRQAVARIK